MSRLRVTVRRWVKRYAERPPAALLEWRTLLERLRRTKLAPALRKRVEARIARDFVAKRR